VLAGWITAEDLAPPEEEGEAEVEAAEGSDATEPASEA
jgi:hypothetical protein